MLFLVLLSTSSARAFEPISIIATLLGAVISPVVCKEIGCTKDVIINMDRSRSNHRLVEMRDNFRWDSDINKTIAPTEGGDFLQRPKGQVNAMDQRSN